MEKKMFGEKPMRVFQCYRMFYGEVPTYKNSNNYVELYEKCQSMMAFLDLFGYSLLYTEEEELKRWYQSDYRFQLQYVPCTCPELDAPIGAMNQILDGKEKEEIEEYYQYSISERAFYDEEITSRLGGLIREFSVEHKMDIVTVLIELRKVLKSEDKMPVTEEAVELKRFAQEELLPLTDLTKEYSANDPRYIEFLKKYLKTPKSSENKVKQINNN